jgi:hypothetical protein
VEYNAKYQLLKLTVALGWTVYQSSRYSRSFTAFITEKFFSSYCKHGKTPINSGPVAFDIFGHSARLKLGILVFKFQGYAFLG